METNSLSGRQPSFWSFVSTDESVEKGQWNFWAIVEIVVAIAVYWYLAIEWRTLIPLYSSLFIAPLLFMRSPASVKQGLVWFEKGFFPLKLLDEPQAQVDVDELYQMRWAWIGAGIGAALTVALNYLGANAFFLGYKGWSGFWRGAVFVYVLIQVAVAIVQVAAGTIVGTDGGRGAGSAVSLAAGAACATALATAVVTGGGAAVMGAGAGAVVFAIAVATALATASGSMMVVSYLPGLGAGILINALIVRFVATARHAIDGYAEMPANIRRLAFFTAPGHAPEILPGLPEKHGFRANIMITRAKQELASSTFSERLAGLITLLSVPLWFAPGWGYRFILKSTLWLWWLLFFVGGAPNVVGGAPGLEADFKKWKVRIPLAAAFAGLTLFVALNALEPAVLNAFGDAPLLPIVAVIFLVDWRSIPFLPLAGFVSSILTIVTWLWADSVVKDAIVADREKEVKIGLSRLAHLIQWKTAFGYLTMVLIMVYIAFYLNAAYLNEGRRGLPIADAALSWFSWLYGEKHARALMPCSEVLSRRNDESGPVSRSVTPPLEPSGFSGHRIGAGFAIGTIQAHLSISGHQWTPYLPNGAAAFSSIKPLLLIGRALDLRPSCLS